MLSPEGRRSRNYMIFSLTSISELASSRSLGIQTGFLGGSAILEHDWTLDNPDVFATKLHFFAGVQYV